MADTSAQRLLDDVLGFARDYAGARVSINVKTNLGPEFSVGEASLGGGGSSSDGARSSSGVSGLLGVKVAVILRDERGRVVASFGDPPATDYVRVLVLGAVLLAVALLVANGMRRAL